MKNKYFICINIFLGLKISYIFFRIFPQLKLKSIENKNIKIIDIHMNEIYIKRNIFHFYLFFAEIKNVLPRLHSVLCPVWIIGVKPIVCVILQIVPKLPVIVRKYFVLSSSYHSLINFGITFLMLYPLSIMPLQSRVCGHWWTGGQGRSRHLLHGWMPQLPVRMSHG